MATAVKWSNKRRLTPLAISDGAEITGYTSDSIILSAASLLFGVRLIIEASHFSESITDEEQKNWIIEKVKHEITHLIPESLLSLKIKIDNEELSLIDIIEIFYLLYKTDNYSDNIHNEDNNCLEKIRLKKIIFSSLSLSCNVALTSPSKAEVLNNSFPQPLLFAIRKDSYFGKTSNSELEELDKSSNRYFLKPNKVTAKSIFPTRLDQCTTNTTLTSIVNEFREKALVLNNTLNPLSWLLDFELLVIKYFSLIPLLYSDQTYISEASPLISITDITHALAATVTSAFIGEVYFQNDKNPFLLVDISISGNSDVINYLYTPTSSEKSNDQNLLEINLGLNTFKECLSSVIQQKILKVFNCCHLSLWSDSHLHFQGLLPNIETYNNDFAEFINNLNLTLIEQSGGGCSISYTSKELSWSNLEKPVFLKSYSDFSSLIELKKLGIINSHFITNPLNSDDKKVNLNFTNFNNNLILNNFEKLELLGKLTLADNSFNSVLLDSVNNVAQTTINDDVIYFFNCLAIQYNQEKKSNKSYPKILKNNFTILSIKIDNWDVLKSHGLSENEMSLTSLIGISDKISLFEHNFLESFLSECYSSTIILENLGSNITLFTPLYNAPLLAQDINSAFSLFTGKNHDITLSAVIVNLNNSLQKTLDSAKYKLINIPNSSILIFEQNTMNDKQHSLEFSWLELKKIIEFERDIRSMYKRGVISKNFLQNLLQITLNIDINLKDEYIIPIWLPKLAQIVDKQVFFEYNFKGNKTELKDKQFSSSYLSSGYNRQKPSSKFSEQRKHFLLRLKRLLGTYGTRLATPINRVLICE
jgi:hypothetical protein